MLENIVGLLPDKDMLILSELLEGSGVGVSPDFRIMDMSFKLFGRRLDKDALSISPEKHILNMFKLVYAGHDIVKVSLLPLLTSIYLVRTKESLHRCPSDSVDESSVFAKVIGKDIFDKCLKRFRLLYKHIACKSKAVPIDIPEALMLSIEARNYFPSIGGMPSFRVLSDVSRLSTFDSFVKKKIPAFTVKSGILYPVPPIKTGPEMEDL